VELFSDRTIVLLFREKSKRRGRNEGSRKEENQREKKKETVDSVFSGKGGERIRRGV